MSTDPQQMSRRQLLRHTAWFGAAVGLTVAGGEVLSHVPEVPADTQGHSPARPALRPGQ